MTGRGYLARLTVIVVSVVVCALLTSQGSVADFKGNQIEARKVPWRAGAAYSVSDGCAYNETAGICEHGGTVPQDTYALDFNMGEGAPVHCSGTGTVVGELGPEQQEGQQGVLRHMADDGQGRGRRRSQGPRLGGQIEDEPHPDDGR
jgi:hypothetical protein